MVSKELIKERLGRFEQLCGIKYSKAVAEIWLEHLTSMDEADFVRRCVIVEKSVKWHIQPTLNDIYMAIVGRWS